jgi:metallo-beta-lactamase family protein
MRLAGKDAAVARYAWMVAMPKPRTNATPYDVQLKKLFAEQPPRSLPAPFSAKTLHGELEHPARGLFTSQIGNINKALRRLWAEGGVVSFVDAQGHLLCEEEHVASGSKAVAHPQIFGLPGSTPPEGASACTYQGHFGAGAGPPDGSAPPDDEAPHASENTGTEAELHIAATAASIDDEQLHKQIVSGKLTEPAPDWLSEEVLRFLVTLPTPLKYFRRGLDAASGTLKARLVLTGIGRKGSFSWDSSQAERLVQLCREDVTIWTNCLGGAIADEERAGRVLKFEDVAALVADPVALFLDSKNDYSSTLLLACGLRAGLGEAQLVDLAEEALASYWEEMESAGRRSVQERIEALEKRLESVGEERDEAVEKEREAREITRRLELRVESLTDDLDRASNELLKKAGSSSEELARLQQSQQDLRQQAEALAAELETARDERSRLQAQLVEQPTIDEIERESLLELSKERRLRDEAEAGLLEALRRIDHVTQQLESREEDPLLSHLPVDAQELAVLLDRAVGSVSIRASQRLQEGNAAPVDELVLLLAGRIAQFGREVSQLTPPPVVAEPVATANEPAVREPPQAETDEQEVERPTRLADRRRTRAGWTVRPLGGGGEIGASALLATSPSGESVLLDCGQRVKGTYGAPSPNNYHFDIPGGASIAAIVITHAHIDHIGSLPVLHRNRFREQGKKSLPVYMSEPTRDLGRIMLLDSAKLQNPRTRGDRVQLGLGEFDVGMMGEQAYNEEDVERVIEQQVETRDPYTPFPVGTTSIVAQLLPVAHVLGSCAVRLHDQRTGRTLLYTGDLGPLAEPQLSLSSYGGLDLIEGADLIVMESTYAAPIENPLGEPPDGRRIPDGDGPRGRRIADLARVCKKTIQNGGSVLLPAFSLGRVQELARILNDGWNDSFTAAPVYIGGMGETITNIYDDYQRRRGPQNEPWVSAGAFVRTTSLHKRLSESTFEETVEEVLDAGPGYILATPAMLGGGWSQQFVERMISEPRHAVVFTGFLPRDVRSSQNLGQLKSGDSFRTRSGNRSPIRCEWMQIGLSAHASRDDLLFFARELAKRSEGCAIAAMHGEPRSQLALADEVRSFEGVADSQSLENGVPWVQLTV